MAKQLPETGSIPLKNETRERFVLEISSGRHATARAAYCAAYRHQHEEGPRPACGVQASKTMHRTDVQDRVAFLRAERARLANAEFETPDNVTADMLEALMREVTDALVRASEAALAVGAGEIADVLMKSIVVHAGRSVRAERRLDTSAAPVNDEAIDILSGAFGRFHYCRCDG